MTKDEKPYREPWRRFMLLLIPRLCLPFSFLIACVFHPPLVRSLFDRQHWSIMWNDPI